MREVDLLNDGFMQWDSDLDIPRLKKQVSSKYDLVTYGADYNDKGEPIWLGFQLMDRENKTFLGTISV